MNHKYQHNPRPVYYKSYGQNIEVSERKVSGYLASFGNKDSDGDLIVKGAFAKSIAERGPNSNTARKIAYLYQHDMRDPLGQFTMLKEDNYGLYFEAELDNIPQADRVLEQYKSGTLNQHSIGFQYVFDKMEYEESTQTFIIKEVNLFEGSVVTIGANENTPFMGMKSEILKTELDILKRDTEKFLKSLPTNMEYEARQLISKHIALAENKEPSKDTLIPEKPQINNNETKQAESNLEEAIKNFKLI